MEFVYWLLLFIKSVVCTEYVKRIDFDLTIQRQGEHKNIVCKQRVSIPGQEHLVYGDEFNIVAHLPYLANNSTNDVAFMWCSDSDEKKMVQGCVTSNINNESICQVKGIFNITTKGQCKYLMMMNSNTRVQPIVKKDLNYYTEAICSLNALQGNLWFTGLDPNRRYITRSANSASYTYIFGADETLYIDCIGPDRKHKPFKYRNHEMDRFKALATYKFHQGANFTCKDNDSTHEIKLTLKAGQVWFTGLNPNQTHRSKDSNYIYKYKRHEEVKIGCKTNMPGGTIIKFHDNGTTENHFEDIYNNIFQYSLGDGANGSYLLCNCKYKYKGDGAVTAKVTFELDKSSYPPPTSSTISTTTAVVTVTPEPNRRQPTPRSTQVPTVKPKQIKAEPNRRQPTPRSTQVPTVKPKQIKAEPNRRQPTPRSTQVPTVKPKQIKAEPNRRQPTPRSTQVPTVKPKQIKGDATIKIAISGNSVKEVNQTEYLYDSTSNEAELNLTCKISMTEKKSRAKYKLEMVDNQRPKQKKSSENFTLSNTKKEFPFSHIFKINANGTIICSLVDISDNFTSIVMNARLRYIFKPIPTAETKHTQAPINTAPNQPNAYTTDETPKETEQTQSYENKGFLKENFTLILGIGAVVVIVCASVCAVIVFKKKLAAPVEENYDNLDKNQHAYNTLPVPKPHAQIPHSSPTVEGNYSEPKDSNDMSNALYADPNRFRESTYAEPYIQTRDLYAKPIPKSQRKPKITDDPNYSNMFGKDYVNSLKK